MRGRSWQPDSYGTGGVTADDYRAIEWFKVDALTGGTAYLSTGAGTRADALLISRCGCGLHLWCHRL